MLLLIKQGTKKMIGLFSLTVLLFIFLLLCNKISQNKKWIVKDSAVKVEEIERFTDGDDTCIVLAVHYNNNEYITLHTKTKIPNP